MQDLAYVCEMCGGVFVYSEEDRKALAEWEHLYGSLKDFKQICPECSRLVLRGMQG